MKFISVSINLAFLVSGLILISSLGRASGLPCANMNSVSLGEKTTFSAPNTSIQSVGNSGKTPSNTGSSLQKSRK